MRKVIHIDIDAFFASVEQRDKPHLQGKPVIICHFNFGRGVVSTASYEARQFGVHSAMPTFQAKKLCPRGYFITPDFEKYQEVSSQLYAILRQYSDDIEAAGMDEAYIEVTRNKKGIPSATWIAQDIRYQFYKETQLTVSAGVSNNKLVAKIATDFQKPNGLTVIRPEEAKKFLEKLPVRKMPGIGPVTESYCHSLNIKTLGDFLKYDISVLREFFGKSADWYQDAAQGLDDRPLEIESEPKSYSVEDTFSEDIVDPLVASAALTNLAQRLETRLQEDGVCGRTIVLKVKYEDHSSSTRRQTLQTTVSDWRTIAETACNLMSKTQIGARPVRLLGIAVSQLFNITEAPPNQLRLFD